jgi:hypothetical protein
MGPFATSAGPQGTTLPFPSPSGRSARRSWRGVLGFSPGHSWQRAARVDAGKAIFLVAAGGVDAGRRETRTGRQSGEMRAGPRRSGPWSVVRGAGNNATRAEDGVEVADDVLGVDLGGERLAGGKHRSTTIWPRCATAREAPAMLSRAITASMTLSTAAHPGRISPLGG